MGGRKSRSLRSIVGLGAAQAKTQLRAAVSAQDPAAIAASAARVLVEAPKPASAVYYAGRLAFAVREILAARTDLGRAAQEAAVRRAWSAIRRDDKLKPDPVLSRLVLSAAFAALPGTRTRKK